MKVTVIPVVVGARETILKGLVKGLEDLEIRKVETIQSATIIKIDKNTEMSPGDLKRLAVSQNPVGNHQLMLVWKTLKGVNNDTIPGYVEKRLDELEISWRIETQHYKNRLEYLYGSWRTEKTPMKNHHLKLVQKTR